MEPKNFKLIGQSTVFSEKFRQVQILDVAKKIKWVKIQGLVKISDGQRYENIVYIQTI